ncbi:cytochrome c553 [Rhodoblastus acidophilus]|nr:cytochrome c553 [Rhodoblastus acidophilus]
MRPVLPILALLPCVALSPGALAAQTDLIAGCIPCHGLDGIGRDAEIPNLAGQNEAYLFNQLKAFRAGRRPHQEMQHMSRHMSDDEMTSLAAYFAQLPPR